MRAPGPGKFASIDALRGIAFLGVFMQHAGSSLVAPLPGPARRVLDTGLSGVDLFYLVSAITLLHSLHARRGEEGRAALKFFARRFFRIAPLFYAGVLFYTLQKWLRGTPGEVPPAEALLMAATFTHGWSPRWINGVVPGGWSIAAEVAFYLMVPSLFARIRTTGRALWAFLAALALAAALNLILRAAIAPRVPGLEGQALVLYEFWWPPAQLPVFLLGFVLYFAIRDRQEGREGSGAADLGPPLLACGIAAQLALCTSSPGRYLPYTALALAPIVAGVILRPHPSIVNRPICALGRLSFGAYLTHFVALDLADWLVLDRVGGNPWAHLGARCLLALPLTVALSALASRFIEQPGQDLGRRIVARIGRSDATASPVMA